MTAVYGVWLIIGLAWAGVVALLGAVMVDLWRSGADRGAPELDGGALERARHACHDLDVAYGKLDNARAGYLPE